METNEKTFNGKMEKLRRPERIEKMEIPRLVKTTLNGLNATSLLDIGTGTGLFAEAFINAGMQVTGIDFNEKMIERVRKLVPAGQFEVASFNALPFETDTFDVSFLGFVLHESADVEQTLREAIRVTRHRIVIQEAPFREEPQGPPLAHRLSPANLITAAEALQVRHFSMRQFDKTVVYLLEGFSK